NLRPRTPAPRSQSRVDLLERFEEDLLGLQEDLQDSGSEDLGYDDADRDRDGFEDEAPRSKRLAPPRAANDRSGAAVRERPQRGETRTRRDERQAEDRSRNVRGRSRRDEDNDNARSQPRRMPTYRPDAQKSQTGLVMILVTTIAAICLGIGIYLWASK